MIGDKTKDRRPKGYAFLFACTYGGGMPPEISIPRFIDGWEIRARLKEWAKSKGIKEYKIHRATDYVKDLHGPAVYEFFVPPPTT
jgi:hypothetical protein